MFLTPPLNAGSDALLCCWLHIPAIAIFNGSFNTSIFLYILET